MMLDTIKVGTMLTEYLCMLNWMNTHETKSTIVVEMCFTLAYPGSFILALTTVPLCFCFIF